MKKLFLSMMLSVFTLAASFAQVDNYSDYTEYGDYSGYDGDFFSLEGALQVFKQSNSIRDFERNLNREDAWVNNLDLNRDGRIDYIRVEHRRQGNYHAIILQVPINRREVQDVAVIEIEKTGRRRAMLQIIGDANLYGEEVIVEPFEGTAYSSGRGGPNADYTFRRGYVNVYYWSAVRNMFRRSYRIYTSPYYWDYYPSYWSPWRPCAWNVFRPRIVVYRNYFHVVYVHRLVNVYNFYRPYRAACPNVFQRNTVIRNTGRRSVYNRASQERLRSNNKARIGTSKAKVKRSKAPTTRTEKSRVGKSSTNSTRFGKSKSRTSTSKTNRGGTSKAQRSARTTTKQNRTNTSRKSKTRSSSFGKSKSTTTRSSSSRKSTTRSTTRKSKTKSYSPRKSTTRSRTKTSSSKMRRRN